MTIAIAYPGQIVRSLCESRHDIVFIDNKGWWIFDHKAGMRRLVDAFSIDLSFDDVDVVATVDRLRRLGPLWDRWVATTGQQEHLLRSLLVYILHIQSGLRYFNVSVVLFHTGVSHHLDSSAIEIACSFCKIPQAFLYVNNITDRLLPLLQFDSISDRRLLGAAVSKYSAADDIVGFRENKLLGNPPKSGGAIPKYQTSAPLALSAILMMKAWKLKSRLREFLRGEGGNFFEQFTEPSMFDDMRLIVRQRRAIQYYLDSVAPDEMIRKTLSDAGRPHLFFAAQFQPEATSFPEGGEMNNHIDIVLKLRNGGYRGPIIYKEHPASMSYFGPVVGSYRVGVSRSIKYYETLMQLGCIFVPPSYKLPFGSESDLGCFPITISGTIALERSLDGRLTAVAGEPWYKGLPGAIPLDAAVRKIATGESISQNAEVAAAAADFLDNALSCKTIQNCPGIGTGSPSSRNYVTTDFREEMEQLFGYLNELGAQHPGQHQNGIPAL